MNGAVAVKSPAFVIVSAVAPATAFAASTAYWFTIVFATETVSAPVCPVSSTGAVAWSASGVAAGGAEHATIPRHTRYSLFIGPV